MNRVVKIAICDDDISQTVCAEKYVQEYKSHLENIDIVCKSYHSSMSLLDDNFDADIYILDIYIDKLTGIDIAKEMRMRSQKINIIFLTKSNSHAMEAFQVRAIHYLQKPIFREELFEALNRCISDMQEENEEKILMCKIPGGVEKIVYESILFIESERKYQHIKLIGKTITVRESLTSLYRQLSDDSAFIMPHRSFIVNMKHIQKIDTEYIQMCNGDEIPLPRGMYKTVKKEYLDYSFSGKHDYLEIID